MANKIPFTLVESVFSTSSKIDREAGVIRDVKVLGVHSRNKGGYDYSPAALQEAAQHYEGIKVNTNHPERSKPNAARGVEEGIGWLAKCRVVEGDGVYADLHVFKSHPLSDLLFEAAERHPAHLGLSHNADGSSVIRSGKRIIESIERVRSVDLVGSPATNNTLFESEEEPVQKRTFKQILESAPATTRGRKGLMKLLEMDGMADMGEMPVEVQAEGTPEDQVWAGFRAAVLSVLDDDSLDISATIAKIVEILKSYDKSFGAAPPTPAAEPPEAPEGTDMVESLQEQLNQLRAELDEKKADEQNRTLLESKQIVVKPHRLATLRTVTDKAERAALLEDWQKADPAPKPGVGKPSRSQPATLLEDQAGYKPAVGAEEMRRRYK